MKFYRAPAVVILAAMAASLVTACAGEQQFHAQTIPFVSPLLQHTYYTCVDANGKVNRDGKNEILYVQLWNPDWDHGRKAEITSQPEGADGKPTVVWRGTLTRNVEHKRGYAGSGFRPKQNPGASVQKTILIAENVRHMHLTIRDLDAAPLFKNLGRDTLVDGIQNNECLTSQGRGKAGVTSADPAAAFHGQNSNFQVAATRGCDGKQTVITIDVTNLTDKARRARIRVGNDKSWANDLIQPFDGEPKTYTARVKSTTPIWVAVVDNNYTLFSHEVDNC